jgi:hypothetical protein
MNFAVDPTALHTYARQLTDAHEVAQVAKRYVVKHGTFTHHEKGLIGLVPFAHDRLMADLDRLLTHLSDLAQASSQAMDGMATRYEHTDLKAAASIDATYPAVPRPQIGFD